MMIELEKPMEWLADLLTAVLIACFSIFAEIPGGRYVSIGLSLLILLLKTRGYFEVEIEPYFIFSILMVLFVFVSSLWAGIPSLSIIKARDMGAILIYFILLYQAYKNDKNTCNLMRSFKWSGYIATFYVIRYCGIRMILHMLLNSDRLGGTIGNSNGWGMAIAFGCSFEFYEICRRKRFTWTSPLLIPAILVIAATQSRKGMLIIVIAFALSLCFYSFNRNNIPKSVISILGVAAIIAVLLYLMKTSTIFSGIYHRMEFLFNYVKGEGEVGGSIKQRDQMIRIGWEQFLRTPILGVGIANAGEVIRTYNDVYYPYLHNNFVELLCCGGAIGFLIYYSRYFYIVYRLFKKRFVMDEGFFPCLILCILFLIIDYGCVTYFEKQFQVYFVLLFLQVRKTEPGATVEVEEKSIRKYRYLIN